MAPVIGGGMKLTGKIGSEIGNKLFNKTTNEVANNVSTAGTRKLNIDDISKIKLYKEKGYFKNINLTENSNARLNQELLSDINLMYRHIEDGVKLKDLFTPSYENYNSALKNTNIGDICQINGSDKISIKINDNTLKELNITPDTYLKLFPPCDRYSFGQQNIGDCYLVSALYNMQTNPNTREILLSCFNEIENGLVEIKLPKGDATFKLDLNNPTKDYTDATKLVSCCEGIKSLEYLYGLEQSYYDVKFNLDDPARCQAKIDKNYKEIEELKAVSEKLDAFAGEDKLISSKDLLIAFGYDDWCDLDNNIDFILALDELCKNSPVSKFITLTDSDGSVLTYSEMQKKHLQNKTTRQFSTDLYNGKMKFNLDLKSFDETQKVQIKEIEEKITIYNNMLKNHKTIDVDSVSNEVRGDGGLSYNVHKKFGLNSRFAAIDEEGLIFEGDNRSIVRFVQKDNECAALLDEALSSTDNGFLINAGTKNIKDCNYINFDKNIITGHAYTIKPVKINGEVHYQAINPWNNAFSYQLTKDELFEYFNQFYISKIK